MAPIHSTGPAVGRNPMASAIAITTAMLAIVWIMLPTTWPVSTDVREIAIVRKRLMIPSVMSEHTATAVAVEPEVAAIRRMPGAM